MGPSAHHILLLPYLDQADSLQAPHITPQGLQFLEDGADHLGTSWSRWEPWVRGTRGWVSSHSRRTRVSGMSQELSALPVTSLCALTCQMVLWQGSWGPGLCGSHSIRVML